MNDVSPVEKVHWVVRESSREQRQAGQRVREYGIVPVVSVFHHMQENPGSIVA